MHEYGEGMPSSHLDNVSAVLSTVFVLLLDLLPFLHLNI